MKYYSGKNGEIFADPISTKGMTEIDSPIREDGTILPLHKSIDDLEKGTNDKLYKYYLSDGKPDLVKIESEKTALSDLIAREYLDSTDWYVVRFQEIGKDIPVEVKTKRAEARNSIV